MDRAGAGDGLGPELVVHLPHRFREFPGYLALSDGHDAVGRRADRLDISEYFTDILLPKLRALGAPIEQDLNLVWVVEEHLGMTEWAEIITKLSQNYTIPAEEINKRFDIEAEEKENPAPPTLQAETVQKINKKTEAYYKKLWLGQ